MRPRIIPLPVYALLLVVDESFLDHLGIFIAQTNGGDVSKVGMVLSTAAGMDRDE